MQWKRVTIFISSTFNDMHAERDYLVKDVFPELREWCEERKIHLVDVDLRWGVTEEDSSSNRTVLACLNNIDNSRPFFLCFLGQRRGWVPKENEISPETLYEYPDVSNVVGRNSVTEIEIEHALLAPMRHIVNGNEHPERSVEHALFYFRKPDYLSGLTEAQRQIFTNKNEKDKNLADIELEIFKEKIRNNWDYTTDYNCYWDKTVISPELLKIRDKNNNIIDRTDGAEKGRLTDFNTNGISLKDIIIQQLKDEIKKEFPDRKDEIEYSSGLERDLDQQKLFIELNSEGFISREGDFDDLNDYISNDKKGLFILSAPAGYGKSMLLANFMINESKKYKARFFNRFCGVSDLCSQQHSLWKTIFDEANIPCPDTLKEIQDNIEDLLKVLAKEQTIIIIDAINQLPDGVTMLEWLPKQLPESLKIVLSLKEDNNDEYLTAIIEKLKNNENVSYSTVKPFEKKDEKKKLIKGYLKKYLKSLDEKQIDMICDSKGSENPLYLKILLSELRIFGSYDQLPEEIKKFGKTPKEAFNRILNRLENDINSLNINAKEFTPILFGLLANARNGLAEEELKDCIHAEIPHIEEEKLLSAIHLYIRQVRQFMARREGRIDYFYEALKLAAEQRINDKIHDNKILADYFMRQADPAGDLSFKGSTIRDFNELPYHLKESNNTGYLEKILSTYLWIKNKSELSDIFNTIGDYNYVDIERGDNYHIKLIKDTLIMSSHILKDFIKNLPVQLWGRLKDVENHRIRELLVEIDKYTDYPWLKPQHYMHAPEESLDVTLPHKSRVNSVCFSPDGKYIASAEDDAVRVWDWKNIKEIRRLERPEGYTYYVMSICFSPDGKYIAIGAGDNTIIVWDWENKKEIQKLEGHTGHMSSVCFSPNGKYIASGSWDKTVRVWDWKKQEEIQRLTGHTTWVNCVCFSVDGKYIASGASDTTVRIWDWENSKEMTKLERHNDEVSSVEFSPDGKYLASGSHDMTIRIWDWKNAKEIIRLKEEWVWSLNNINEVKNLQANFVSSIYFSPNGKYIISGSSGSNEAMPVRVWDWEKQEVVQRLDGHIGRIDSVCFSPDGKYIASGSSDHTVRVWNFKNMKTTQRHKGHSSPIESMCISPVGKYIASGSDDSSIRIWGLENIKEEVKILGREKIFVKCVCFSPDGKYIASGYLGKYLAGYLRETIEIWDWEKQIVVQRLEGHTDAVLCISFSIDGKYIASGSMDNTVRIWDWKNQKEVLKIDDKNYIYSICFSNDGKYLAIGGNREIRIWNWENQKEIQRLDGNNSGSSRSLCFSPDGKYLTSGSLHGTIEVWDWKNAKEIQGLEDHAGSVNSVCFSNGGKYILSGSEDQTIRVWEWRKHKQTLLINTEEKISSCFFLYDNRKIVAGGSTGQILLYDVENLPIEIINDLTEKPIICMEEEIQRLEGHEWEVYSVCFSPNGRYIASGGWDHTIRIWDWKNSNEIRKLEGHEGSVHSVCFFPDGKYIASGAWEETVRVWDWERQKETQRFDSHKWRVSSVCFSPDGKYIASVSFMEDTIKVWDCEKEKEVQIQTNHTKGVCCVCFSPDGKYLVSGSNDKTIKVWEWEKQKEVQVMAHSDSVTSVCFSPDGKYIISGSWDRTVRIWEWEKRKEIRRLEGHTWVVTDVCFSGDGEYIVSGSRDRTIRVWDWKNNCEVQRLEGHTWDVTSVCFSPDGKYIVSGSRDGTVRVWDWGKNKHTQMK